MDQERGEDEQANALDTAPWTSDVEESHKRQRVGARKQAKTAQRWYDLGTRYENVMAALQAAIFVVGCGVAFIYSGQLSAMRESIEIANRPWVLLGEIEPGFSIEPNVPATLRFYLDNTGKGPATGVTIRDVSEVCDCLARFPQERLDSVPPHPAGDIGEGRSRLVIGEAPYVLNDTTVAGIKSGRKILRVYMLIQYADFFSRHRETTACLQYVPPSSAAPSGFNSCLGVPANLK